jgi:beta-mannosidase
MYGYRGWRKQWGQNRFCGGALVWQLNDCWPVTSWSIVDYYLRKKPAYYAMRRVLAPVAVAIRRAHWDWSVVHARPTKEAAWECWVASSEASAAGDAPPPPTRAEVRFVSIATGRDIKPPLVKTVALVPNGTTPVLAGVVDNVADEPHVLAVRLWRGDTVVARDCDWPQPLKYLDFAERGVRVDAVAGDEAGGETTTLLRVSAARPTKGLVFEEREGVLVEDSALDVVPGDEQVVRVRGLKTGDAPLAWRYLGG